jgi:membrane fusion protein, multidrug efflux system
MTSIFSFERAVATATIVLASCGGSATHQEQQSTVTSTEVVKTETFPETRVTTGSVRSVTVSPLTAKVVGNVTRVLVTEGQRVRAGEVLVEIDDREGRARSDAAAGGADEVQQSISGLTAAIAAAGANADLANATFKRFAALRERGSVSAQEYEEVAARKAAAEAALTAAKRSRDAMIARGAQARASNVGAQTFLSYTRVRSPMDGVVTARLIDPGAQAAPGVPLVIVEDDSRFRVDTTVDETLAAQLRVGQRAIVDGTIGGRIVNIAPAVDPITRSALVKIDLPARSALRSGAFVRVAFPVGSRNVLTVPATAVIRRGSLTSIFIVDRQQTVRMRLVSLGDRHESRVEVLAGLDPGERIVIQPTPAVRDGVKVRS